MGARRKVKQIKPVQVTPQSRFPRLGRVIGSVMVLSALGSLVGVGGWWLSQPDTLPIQRVQVEGEFRYLAQEDLYRAIGDLASGGFFNVGVRAVKEAAESLPWVDKASVRRQWPDTLQVVITEQVPLAHWGQQQVVNVRGELFEPPLQGLSETLPHFTGPEGSSQLVAARYQELSSQLAAAELLVTELHLSSRRAWEMKLQNGLRLVLGRSVNDSQLQRFIKVYPKLQVEKDRLMQSVDLRYSNGFAVRWQIAEENV